MDSHLATRGIDAGAANGPRLLLADHHRSLEAAYNALLAATYADDPRDLVARFRIFEHAILEHVRAEEEEILPIYELYAPAEARRIREDHERIRQWLTKLGVDVELHEIRLETMKELIAALRAHSTFEDKYMYPWAQLYLPLRARRTLFVRIGRSLRNLTRITERPAGPEQT